MSDELNRLKADLEVLERWQHKHDLMAGQAILNIKKDIARLEADEADPWRDVKEKIDLYRVRTDTQTVQVIAYIDHLNAEVARLMARVAELEAEAKAEDDEDLGDAEEALANLKAFVSEFPPRRAEDESCRSIADMQPPFEGPIESIEPVLDSARVLATARWFLNNSDKDIHGTIAYLIAFHCGDSSNAKPYKLKGDGK